MQGLEFVGVGGMLLLVLPLLSIACVLLTSPVARAIGRRQHEEEQVLRAPLIVALISVIAEGALALALLRQPALRGGAPLPVGPLYFGLTTYGVAGVFSLAAFVLMLLVATEFSRAEPAVLGTDELAGVLFAWGGQTLLALSDGLPTALVGVSLTGVAASLLLVLEALKHRRRARLWLIAWAVLIPLGVWLLLWPLHGRELGSDLLDARALLRSGGARTAEALLLRGWLAAGLAAVAGLVAFVSIPRVPVSLSPGPAILAGGAVIGALPALCRVTGAVLPAGALADGWLGPHLRAVWIAAGVIALAVALLRLSTWRRLCLLSVGCVCGLGWSLAFAGVPRSALVLAGPVAAALALPLCFGAAVALEATRLSPSSAPRSLPLPATVLFPALALLAGPWLAAAGLGGPLGAQLGGFLLGVLLAAVALLSVAVPLINDRREALSYGHFPGLHPGGLRGWLTLDRGVLVLWLVLAALAAGWWAVGLEDLLRLLP
ncbi:MAG: hypothetical protein FJX75_21220 [Armatimonadetes bacterium]|nr:hypothetical protein [Armatimonadota bacterium]